MIVYSSKFQAVALQKESKSKNSNNKLLSIKNITINATKSVKLLRIAIYSDLNFEEQSLFPVKKVYLWLSTISCFQKYVRKNKEKPTVSSILISSIVPYLVFWLV